MTTPVQEATRPNISAAFSMPVISPMIGVPPPYVYRDTKALNVLFKSDAAVLRRLVPEPLRPNPDQPVVFYIGHFQFADFDLPYNEAGLLVPVNYGAKAGLFAVVLYLDKANPIVGGREIYGWPKKHPEQVLFQEEQGRIVAGVTRYGKQIIKASFEAEHLIDPILPRPKDTLYLLKVIPTLEKDAPPDVLKLNAMVIDPDVIKQLHVGKATLEFGASPFDSFLSEIPVNEITYSELMVHDFILGHGRTVIDYLKE